MEKLSILEVLELRVIWENLENREELEKMDFNFEDFCGEIALSVKP